jgi:hypothetical protein
MAKPSDLHVSTQLERKDPRLPAYAVIPGRHVRPWGLTGTTVVEGTANGFPLGRRTIKAWGKGSDDWFLEFTAAFCTSAQLGVGDTVTLQLRLADTSTPKELKDMLDADPRLATAWQALSERERREAGEYIRAAKTQATRERRAASIAERL